MLNSCTGPVLPTPMLPPMSTTSTMGITSGYSSSSSPALVRAPVQISLQRHEIWGKGGKRGRVGETRMFGEAYRRSVGQISRFRRDQLLPVLQTGQSGLKTSSSALCYCEG
jgi:hypothetical protein